MKTEFNIGDKVMATLIINGYWKDLYGGVIIGFTPNGRIKVKSVKYGIKFHQPYQLTLRCK